MRSRPDFEGVPLSNFSRRKKLIATPLQHPHYPNVFCRCIGMLDYTLAGRFASRPYGTRATSAQRDCLANTHWVYAMIWLERTSWRTPQSCAGRAPLPRRLASAGPLRVCDPRIASCSSGSIPGWRHPITAVRSGGTNLKTISATSAQTLAPPKRDDELPSRH